MKYKNLALFYASLDAALIAVCSYFGAIYVLNSQVALTCSCVILFASFNGYKKRVASKASEITSSEVDLNDEKDQFWDASDCCENNSNLKSDSNLNDETTDVSNLKTKKIADADKISVSKFEILSALKPMRLLAYALLIIAFFALERRELFEPFSFLSGVAVMPVGALLAGVFQNAKL